MSDAADLPQIEDDDIEVYLPLDGSHYYLLRQTTGADLIYMQQNSIVEVKPDSAADDIFEGKNASERREIIDAATKASTEYRTDSNLYEFHNVVIRLRISPDENSEIRARLKAKEVGALPRTHFMTLSTIGLQLDNEEAGKASDFLSVHLQRFPALASAWEKFSTAPVNTSEPLSSSETNSENESETEAS